MATPLLLLRLETLGEDGSCMAQCGNIKVWVKSNKMKLVERGTQETSASSSAKGKGQTLKRSSSSSETNQDANISFGPLVQTLKNTVDLRGMRVSEASYQLQMAIDRCRSHQVLFVVHGMGTGAVKDCALDILRNHPRVAKFEDESSLNCSCTIAYIEYTDHCTAPYKILHTSTTYTDHHTQLIRTIHTVWHTLCKCNRKSEAMIRQMRWTKDGPGINRVLEHWS